MAGGGSSSSSNTTNNYDQRQVNTNTSYDLSNRSTTNTTNNNTTNADFSNRSVNTSNTTTNADFSNRSTTSSNSNNTTNLWDASTTNSNSNNTTNADFSNRSVNNTSTTSNSNNTSTTNADFSNRSTTNNSTSTSLWDGSNSNNTTNTTTYNTTTDGGAVSAAVGLAGGALDKITSLAKSVVDGSSANEVHAYDYADNVFHSVIDYANQNDNRALSAFDRAATMESTALDQMAKNSQAVIGQLQGAYADAKGTSASQQKIIMGVLALVGVLVLSMKKV